MAARWLPVLLAAILAAGCGNGGQAPPPARPFDDPGFVTDGVLSLHYALTPTMDLPPEIARSYDIKRRPNLALLTVAVAPADDRTRSAIVEAQAVSLLGERLALPLRIVDQAGGPSRIALVGLRHREAVTIEVRARVAGHNELVARFTREFHLD